MGRDTALLKEYEEHRKKQRKRGATRIVSSLGQLIFVIALALVTYRIFTDALPQVYFAFREANRLPEK
jgi:hypothetical protein